MAACLRVMGLALNARAELGLEKGGQEKPSFIRMGIERWLGTMKDRRAAMFE